MPHELQKEIENHLATFPERYKEVAEMRKEWNEYKTKTFWVLIGFISSILTIGVWVGATVNRIDSISEYVDSNTKSNSEYERRITALEINNGEVRARLASIEVTLQEIKTAIIRLQ